MHGAANQSLGRGGRVCVHGSDRRGVCAVQCGGFVAPTGAGGNLEQHLVFVVGIRGDQLHKELDVRGFCGRGVMGGCLSFDDVVAKTARRSVRDRLVQFPASASEPDEGAVQEFGDKIERRRMVANSLVMKRQTCYVCAAFVALVTPLESIEGAARILAASFALRLEAVEK